MEQKKRNSILRIPSKEDTQSTTGNDVRLPRRISFRTKKTVRVFCKDEDAQNWDNYEYEESERADSSSNSKTVVNSSTDLQATASTSALCTTSEFINKSNQGELIVEGSLAITLTEYEKNCMNKIKTDCTSSNQSDVIRKQQNNSTVKALPPPPTSEPIPSLACFDDNSNKENIPSECYGIGTKTGKKSSKDDDELSSSANMDIDSSANNFYSNTKSPKVIVRHEASYQQRIVTPAEEEESLEITHTEGGGLENNFSGIYPIEQSPLTSSFVMNNTDEFVQLNNDIGNGRMTPFRNYNNKKSSISVPNKKSFLSLEQRKPNHHHHISELSNRQNMDVGTLSLRTNNNNNNNNTMYNTLEIAAETAKKQGAIPKRKSTYGGQMSLETICFDEEEDNIRKQKDMTRSKMAIDKENISQETQPPPHIACSSSTNKIFGRRTIYFSDEIIAEPQPMEETQMKIWNEIQKFNSERITFDNEKCIEKANRKASLYLNESLNISSKSSSNEKIEESQKQIMETQEFGSTISKEKSHLGESKQKPYIEDGDYDQRRRHINKKDNKILIEDIHNSKQNDVISSTSTFRQNYSEATVTNKNLESYRPGHTFIGQNRLMSEMCHKRLFSTFETLDSPAFVQHPKSTDIEEFQIAATSETIRDTNNIEEIVVAIPQQQKQQSTSCRRTQVFENSAALMELNDDEPLPDENVVAKDLREKQKASRKTLHFGNDDDDDDDGRIDFTINERKEEEQVCKKKLEFLHRSSTDAAIDTATNDDLVKKVPKSANRRTVTFSSSVVVDTNSIESTPLYHRKTNFSNQFNAYSPATPHRSVLEFEQLERQTLQDDGGGDDPNSFIKDRSCQKRSPSIFTPNIPQSKKRHYKTQFFDNLNNVMDIDGDDRREELVMHHGLQADVVDNTMETSRGAINQEDNLCVDGDEVANRNDLARSSFVVNDTKWQSHIFNYDPNTFIEEEEKRREKSNNEEEIHHIEVNETITTNAENPIDPKKLIATLSSSIKERTPSRIPIYFNGSEKKKEMKQLSIKSPNDASLQTSIPTMRTDQMINETAHLTIENRSVQKKIIFECDDKPITVSDVSQHYLSSHRQQQSIEDGGRKEEEEEDGSGKPIIESPINASDDIDKTKLDLVETFLGESESSSSCIDLDDDIDDIDIFRCQSFQCENMAVVEEEETNNKKPSPSSSVFLCRKCRNCLQNETATASPSETFVMPSALPTLEEIAEEIEKKMIKYRKGPTLEKALELYKQWNLDDMFSESSSSEDEEITEESIIENNAFLKEAVERSKRITREYEERWAQIEENAKKKVIKCFVSRLKDLLDNNKNAHLWIMNAEMMHRQVLQFRYKEISTFCIILQYEKADIFGDNVVITHISLESSSVAERTLTPFDHMIRIQLQLEIPFNLKSYCNGNTEFDVYEMLMKVDNICKNVLKMAKELWINVNEEDASLTIVNGHGHIKKIVRKKIYDENGYYQSTKLTNFCIEVIDIKNLCFKDIVMPPTYMFREDIENLPAGLEFLKIFLKNPKSFLKEPDN